MGIRARRKLFIVKFNDIDLREKNDLYLSPQFETSDKETIISTNPPSPCRRYWHCLDTESGTAADTTLPSWSYCNTRSLKGGAASFLRQEVARRTRCASHSFGPQDHCKVCQDNVEALLKNIEPIFEEDFKYIWEEKIQRRYLMVHYRSIFVWERLLPIKKRLFYRAIGLQKFKDFIESLAERGEELHDCYYAVRAAYFDYLDEILRPLWKNIWRRRREEIFETLVALTARLANMLATLDTVSTQTALALRERKLLC